MKGRRRAQLSTLSELDLFLRCFHADSAPVAPSDADRKAMEALCEQVCGHPLAIRLAAAHARHTTLAQTRQALVTQLHRVPDTGAARDIKPGVLRAALACNLALLDARQQAFWSRLVVFRGGWSVVAAEQACKEPQAAAFCETLTALALITRADGASVPRFVLPDEFRALAQEFLTAEDWNALRAAHRAFFGDLARRAESFLQRSADPTWLERLEEEQANVLRAADSARGSESLELAVCLWRWCLEKSHYAEGQRMVAYALARCGPVPPRLRAEGCRGLGVLLYRQNHLAQAEQCLRIGLQIARQSGLAEAIPHLLHHLANLARDTARYEEARDFHTLSYDLWRSQNDIWGQATALNSLGILDWTQSHLAEAQRTLRRSAALFAQINDTRQAVKVLTNVAAIASEGGHYALAEQTYRACLLIHRNLGERYFVATNLHNLGDICCHTGKTAEAVLSLKESVALLHSLGSLAYMPLSVYSLGKAYHLRQDFKRAALLMGAFDNLHAQADTVLPASSLQELQDILTAVRAALPVRSFTRYWNQGRRMSVAQVLEYIASL